MIELSTPRSNGCSIGYFQKYVILLAVLLACLFMTACTGEMSGPPDLQHVKNEMHKLMKKGKTKEALDLVHISFARLRNQDDPQWLKRCELYDLFGNLNYIEGNFFQALSGFSEVHLLMKAMKKPALSARALAKEGAVQYEMGQYVEAEKTLLAARKTMQQLIQEGDTGQKRMLSWTNMILSNFYLSLEEFEKSKEMRSSNEFLFL